MAGLHVPLSTLRHSPRGPSTHDLGPSWIATPSMSGVLIPFLMPVHPGAFPTFTFEQIVLRFVVGVLFIALFVLIVEFAQVRGRVGGLETGGAPAPAAATQDPLGSPQSFKVVLKEMEVIPKVVEVPAGTPVTLNVVNQGAVPHNLTVEGGPKTPDLKPGGKATLELGTVTRTMTGECSIPGHKDAGMTFEVRVGRTAPAAAAATEHTDASLDDS